MSMLYVGQPDWYSIALEYANLIFAGIFTIEAILKIVAFGPGAYFRSNWNLFDFFIVVATILGIVASAVVGGSVGAVATVVRTFRIARVLRLIQSAKQVRVLFITLAAALPAVYNVGFLVLLICFIYTAIGVSLFAKIGFGDEPMFGATFCCCCCCCCCIFKRFDEMTENEKISFILHAQTTDRFVFHDVQVSVHMPIL